MLDTILAKLVFLSLIEKKPHRTVISGSTPSMGFTP